MKNVFSRGTSLAIIASLLLSPIAAQAQTVPGGNVNTGTTAPPASVDTSGMSRLDDQVIVRGDPYTVGERVRDSRAIPDGAQRQATLNAAMPTAPRFLVDSDDNMRITRRAWLANGWPEEQFDARRAQNTVFCSRIDERVLKYDYVIQRYTVLKGKVPAFAERYSKMRKQIKRTQAFSTVFNILGIGATALIPGASLAYVGVVGANAASGEVRGRTSTKGQLLNNDHGEFTLELDDLHIETAIMSAEEHQDYLAMMVNTCANSKFN